jgi:hypothetical protein
MPIQPKLFQFCFEWLPVFFIGYMLDICNAH